ncbi:hypothetical protein D3C85_1190030 [compost metagenome]
MCAWGFRQSRAFVRPCRARHDSRGRQSGRGRLRRARCRDRCLVDGGCRCRGDPGRRARIDRRWCSGTPHSPRGVTPPLLSCFRPKPLSPHCSDVSSHAHSRTRRFPGDDQGFATETANVGSTPSLPRAHRQRPHVQQLRAAQRRIRAPSRRSGRRQSHDADLQWNHRDRACIEVALRAGRSLPDAGVHLHRQRARGVQCRADAVPA